jgi:AhpD family alkylhydroperoxidase
MKTLDVNRYARLWRALHFFTGTPEACLPAVWYIRVRTKQLKGTTVMDDFDLYRADMNEKLVGSGHLGIKRFFALDTQAYEDGALDKKTKELMGLTGSIVLRCDDCITYHIKQCADVGVTREQFMDAFNVALVVGGSITIPHLRRAVDKLDQVLANQ